MRACVRESYGSGVWNRSGLGTVQKEQDHLFSLFVVRHEKDWDDVQLCSACTADECTQVGGLLDNAVLSLIPTHDRRWSKVSPQKREAHPTSAAYLFLY